LVLGHSSTFRARFAKELLENQITNEMKLEKFDAPSLKLLMDYLYKGEINAVGMPNYIRLFALGKYFELRDLMSVCEEKMSEPFDIDLALQAFILSSLHGLADLQTRASCFILK